MIRRSLLFPNGMIGLPFHLFDPLLDLIDVLLPNEAEICRIAHRDTLDEAVDVLSKRVPV